MAIADDVSVAVNGDIRYTGTTANYTVLELHRFLQDLADDAEAAGDDLLDIVDETPSDRSTDNIIKLINGYNIDDTMAQHLYDGSILQGAGATETLYSGLVVVGTVVAGTELQILQFDGAPLEGVKITSFWSTGINADAANNIITRMLIKTRDAGRDIDGKRIIVTAREFNDTYGEFSVTLGLGNSTAAIFTSDDLNNDTAQATVAAWDQFSNTEGYQAIDIAGDGDSSDEHYFHQWAIGGGTTPASPTLANLYEWTKNITRRGGADTIHGIDAEVFRGITHEIDYDNQSGADFVEDDFIVWGTTLAYDNEVGGPFTLGEKLTFGTSNAVGTLLKLTDNGTTGVMVVAIEPGTGTVVDNEQITGASSSATADVDGVTRLVNTSAVGGAGIILAHDDNGTTGTLWIQLTGGVAPTDNLPIHATNGVAVTANAGEADVNLSPSSFSPNPEFFGTFTGSAIIGGFGIGMDPTDTSASDLFFPLEGGTVSPPNNVTFTVFGLVSGEDRVLVGPEDGSGGLDLDQMVTDTTLSGAAETSVSINPTPGIPIDTPSPSGTIRIERDNGVYSRHPYSAVDTGTDTFTITSHDFSTNNATQPANVFVSYIDKLAAATSESFTTVFNSARTLFIRVRDGGTAGDAQGIKTFETTATLGSGGGSATAIRTSDA